MPGTGALLRAVPGMTYRRIEHWIERGLIKPKGVAAPGPGHTRDWDRSEIEVVATMMLLVDAGFDLSKSARLARSIQGNQRNSVRIGSSRDGSKTLWLTISPTPER